MSVSVILPVYNAGAYLSACLDSLLAQTHRDFELIAVDDGSTDGSTQVLQTYAERDARIRLIVQPQNAGETRAMQLGMATASREFHARMDQDDLCAPNRLEMQLRWMQDHPKCTVLGSNMQLIGESQGATNLPLADGQIKANFVIARANICNPTAMWRADWLAQRGIRYGDLRNVSDFGLWVDCMLAGAQFRNLPGRLVSYRIHAAQASSNRQATDEGAQSIVEKLLHHWYPSLSPEQVTALASICHSTGNKSLGRAQVQLALELVEAVKDLKDARYGEDRKLVRQHLLGRAAVWRQAMAPA